MRSVHARAVFRPRLPRHSAQVVTVQFHLLNTGLLFLSREGFRRACLRLDAKTAGGRAKVLGTSALAVPVGVALSAAAYAAFSGLRRRGEGGVDGAAGGEGPASAASSWSAALLLQLLAVLLELLGEPLYALASSQGRYAVRALAEGAAAIAKAGAALALLRGWRPAALGALADRLGVSLSDPAVAFSVAQCAYAAAWTAVMCAEELLRRKGPGEAPGAARGGGAAPRASIDGPTLRLAGVYGVQAAQKLVLAEGSKAALAAFAPTDEQGVYGLVTGLAGLAARLAFQPAEEAAFESFSRFAHAQTGQGETTEGTEAEAKDGAEGKGIGEGEEKGRFEGSSKPPAGTEAAKNGTENAAVALGGSRSTQSASSTAPPSGPSSSSAPTASFSAKASPSEYRALCLLSRLTTTLGLFAASFAPGLAHAAIALLYSPAWAATEAPALLALAGTQLLVLAANGMAEAYLHATCDARQLRRANAFLLKAAVAHVALAVPAARLGGGAGLLVADGLDAAARFVYCLGHARRRAPSGASLPRDLWPAANTVRACALAGATLLAARVALLPESSLLVQTLSSALPRNAWPTSVARALGAISETPARRRLAALVLLGGALVGGAALETLRAERDAIAAARAALRRRR